jgi:hypothetical protein
MTFRLIGGSSSSSKKIKSDFKRPMSYVIIIEIDSPNSHHLFDIEGSYSTPRLSAENMKHHLRRGNERASVVSQTEKKQNDYDCLLVHSTELFHVCLHIQIATEIKLFSRLFV